MLFCLALVVCFVPGSVFGQNIWTASSMRKVFRDDHAESNKRFLNLAAARNEYVAGQVVVRAGDRPLKHVTVSVSDLVRDEGGTSNTIAADRIQIKRVDYVHLSAPGKSGVRNKKLVTKAAKDYPDALPPYKPLDVKANTTQPIWLDLMTPTDAAAGMYRGQVTLHFQNGASPSVPILLRIWDFTLPDKPSVRSIISGALRTEGREGEAAKQMKRRYYDFWLNRRLSPQTIPAPLDSKEAIHWYQDDRMTAFRIGPSNRAKHADRYKHLKAIWKQYGVLDKAVVRSIDEPSREAQFNRMSRLTKRNQGLDQIVCFNRAVPGKWAHDRNFFQIVGDGLDIWCPILNLMSNSTIRQTAAQRQREGDEIWWYVCSWPKPPYPNFFVDGDGIEPRITFWMMWAYHIDGFLYYGGTRWHGKNPYETAAVRDKWPNLYGDGYLAYPGKPVGVDGPVGSIRLANIRDGVEDHTYLAMLAKQANKTLATHFVSRIVRNLKKYSHDPGDLAAVRRKVGWWLDRHAADADSRSHAKSNRVSR